MLVKLGHKRRIEVVAPSFATVATMVIGTDRIATMHERLAAIFTRSFPLKLMNMPVRIPEIRETLQWPASFHNDPAIVWMRGIICDVAAKIDRTPTTRMVL